jgi:hypothetical protein
MIRTRALAIPATFALLFVAGSATASTPSTSGTVSPPPSGQTTTYTWIGTLPGGANPSSACTGQNALTEDHHSVALSLAGKFYSKHRLFMAFSITPDTPTADVILSVKDPSGSYSSSDNGAVGSGELVTYLNPAGGGFDAVACTFAGGPTSYHGKLTLTTDPPRATAGGSSPGVTAPGYTNHTSPAGVGDDAGEPSIGVNWNTNAGNGGTAMFQAVFDTLKVTFDDSTTPSTATWQNVSAPWTNLTTLDPILDTDSVHGRTFVSQLTGQDSLSAYSDNDGASWTPSQGGGIPSGVDHQSVGNGPYPAGSPFAAVAAAAGYPNAVYYCSQDLATAFCARSDNGGLTFGAGVPIYTSECGGLHGHVAVAPDGTVYVPNKGCRGHQGLSVSTDAGQSWTVRTVPMSSPGQTDPSIGVGADGTVYYGYADGDGHAKVAVSHDRGSTWTTPVDVGAKFGLQNSVFPETVAGDGARAAFAFLGTTTAGNFNNGTFGDANGDGFYESGEWHLYVSTTYDGGQTWSTADATPKDPVQRGAICTTGISCTGNTRNLLDFNDITVDKFGRALVAYADGCMGACVTSTKVSDNAHTAKAVIARQSSGKGLFAAYGG